MPVSGLWYVQSWNEPIHWFVVEQQRCFFGYFSNKTLLAPAFQMGQLVAFVISMSLNYNRHFVLFFLNILSQNASLRK